MNNNERVFIIIDGNNFYHRLKELAQTIYGAFRALREEIQEQIENLDKKPGLTKGEKQVRDKLQEALDVSEEFISKELKDVEKELE